MKPHQYDMLNMQITKTANRACRLSSLIRILNFIEEQNSYDRPLSDIAELRDFIESYANLLNRDALNLETYFEFKMQ